MAQSSLLQVPVIQPNARNQYIARLLAEGSKTDPVQHWTQGMARALQGAFGGLERGRLEHEEKQGQAAQNQTLAMLLGGIPLQGTAPAPPPSRGAPPIGFAPPAPPMGAPPSQNVTAPVPQDDPTMTVSPRQVAQANPGAAPTPTPSPPAPPGPMQGAQPPMTSSALPPNVQARIAAMLDPRQPPAVQAMGRQLAAQAVSQMMKGPKYEKLDEATLYDQNTGQTRAVGGDRRPLTDPEERRRFGIPDDDKRPYQVGPNNRLINPPAETRVNMSTVADPILKGVGEQFVESRKVATGVPERIGLIHDARRQLDQGAITGAVADWRLTAAKLFGLSPDQVANTETFRATVGREVLSNIKALGANPSNADRDYIERVSGGQITLDEASLRRILDINEKYARQALRNFNRDAKALMDRNPDAYRSVAPLMSVEEPGEYEAPERAAPAANAAPARGGGWQTLPNGVRIRPKQ